ncbi:hypothetical protein Q3G72_003728 [Acer saccharum]|nr:hypothetical protein Q3G72_003728 [Acer saccharum]
MLSPTLFELGGMSPLCFCLLRSGFKEGREIESSKKKSSTVGHTEDTFEGVPPLEKQREYKGRGKRRREEEEKGKRKRKERKPTGKKKEREMANGDEGEKRPSTAVKLKEDLRQKW